LFGRVGGEEFAAILWAGDIGEAVAIADRVRRNFVSAAAGHGTADLTPSVSVGVTLGCDPHHPITGLLAAADQALYRAKANGRNRVECSEPIMAAGAQEAAADAGERRSWRKLAVRA
jgi:diguanylate cyclase (GGDEF)-like protein